MRTDSMCTANALHRCVTITSWCDDCRKWHSRLSLQRRLGSSSRRWEVICSGEEDDSQESIEAHLATAVSRVVLLELQRLYAEEQAGVSRLF